MNYKQISRAQSAATELHRKIDVADETCDGCCFDCWNHDKTCPAFDRIAKGITMSEYAKRGVLAHYI